MLTTPKLTQIGERFHASKTRFVAVFACICGNKAILGWHDVESKKTLSCGCHRRSLLNNMSHGMCRTKTYQTWSNMLTRCTNTNNDGYANYGDRGITVCKEWSTFQGFVADMGECPKGLTIERLDNDGNYCKDNCIWATHEAQARNTRRNKLITFNGETKCLQEWANELGISRNVISARLRMGWSTEDALTAPVRHMNFE